MPESATHRPVPETPARPPPPNSQRFLMGIGFWAYANIRNLMGLFLSGSQPDKHLPDSPEHGERSARWHQAVIYRP